jgi:hypothetical protein
LKTIEEFKEKGYTVVKNAINKELCDFVTQYALFDEMQDFTPDGQQVPAAHSKYADPAMETMLLHLHLLMEKNTGLELHPTYSFYRVYRNGDVLEPHKDRPSCEISCTLCFNYSYDDSQYTWPIFMDGYKAELKPGDLVIYRGIELEHWREPFDIKEDAWHVQGFFHYVNKNGPHAEWKWDKRDSVGELKNKINNKKYIKYV